MGVPVIQNKTKQTQKTPKQTLKHLMVTTNTETPLGHVAETKSRISWEMLESLCAEEDEDVPVWMQDPCLKGQAALEAAVFVPRGGDRIHGSEPRFMQKSQKG